MSLFRRRKSWFVAEWWLDLNKISTTNHQNKCKIHIQVQKIELKTTWDAWRLLNPTVGVLNTAFTIDGTWSPLYGEVGSHHRVHFREIVRLELVGGEIMLFTRKPIGRSIRSPMHSWVVFELPWIRKNSPNFWSIEACKHTHILFLAHTYTHVHRDTRICIHIPFTICRASRRTACEKAPYWAVK